MKSHHHKSISFKIQHVVAVPFGLDWESEEGGVRESQTNFDRDKTNVWAP